MGAWAGYGLGSENQDLPGFVVVNGGLVPPGGLDNFNAGYLPAAYQGSVFRNAGIANVQRSDPSDAHQRAKLNFMRKLDSENLKRAG